MMMKGNIWALCIICLLMYASVYDVGGHSLAGVKTTQLGISMAGCDTGKDNLTKDFDDSTNIEYACQGDYFPPNSQPLHVCMQNEIFYENTPPMSGPHRYVWPEYGEYSFIPPQRWVHALEHGAIVLLYHPCADPNEVNVLRKLLVGCKRRHIITPYRNLTQERPLALVAWGCKLELGRPDTDMARDFIKGFSLNTNEVRTMFGNPWSVFDKGLIKPALTVSTNSDAIVCPAEFQVDRGIKKQVMPSRKLRRLYRLFENIRPESHLNN